MSEAGSVLLVAGAVGSVGVGILHVGIVVVGNLARNLDYFRAGPRLVALALRGSLIPHLVTIAAAIVFSAFAWPPLAHLGLLLQVPFSRELTIGIGAVYSLRGLVLPLQLVGRFPQSEPRDSAFSAVSLGIGLLYLVGVTLR